MLFLRLLMRIAPALVFRSLAELRNVHGSFPVWCISIICSFKWHHSCLLQCHVKLVTEFHSKSSLCSSSHGEEQKDFILWGHSFKRSEHLKTPPKNESFGSTKPVSSVVVSVLADPREAGDGDGEGRIPSKSLPRIFVVVLIDSVKYVTYSCVLPFKSHSPHL
jgi:hypothetical protein